MTQDGCACCVDGEGGDDRAVAGMGDGGGARPSALPVSGFVRACTEGVSVSFPNDSKCGFSFDEIHGLRNLMREPALASALDEISR